MSKVHGSKEAYERFRFMKNGQICSNCGFGTPAQNITRVVCRRYPPTELMVVTPQGAGFATRFPEPHAKWTCGEWKSKIIAANIIDNENAIDLETTPKP